METKEARFHVSMYKKVLTVPMRNGNFGNFSGSYKWSGGSYRTYEEWKLGTMSNHLFQAQVLTVPMRNGNFQVFGLNRVVLQFLPYL